MNSILQQLLPSCFRNMTKIDIIKQTCILYNHHSYIRKLWLVWIHFCLLVSVFTAPILETVIGLNTFLLASFYFYSNCNQKLWLVWICFCLLLSVLTATVVITTSTNKTSKKQFTVFRQMAWKSYIFACLPNLYRGEGGFMRQCKVIRWWKINEVVQVWRIQIHACNVCICTCLWAFLKCPWTYHTRLSMTPAGNCLLLCLNEVAGLQSRPQKSEMHSEQSD